MSTKKKKPTTKLATKKVDKLVDKPLTEFELRFCAEYVVDLNGTQAFLRAGGEVKDSSAATMASTLLRKMKVQAQIQHLASERSERTQINADTILLELLKMAKVNYSELYDSSGTLLRPHEWPEGLGACVSSVELNDFGGIKKVKLWDKGRALEALGKHLKLFTEKVEHSGTIALEDIIGGSFKKVDK